MPFSNLVYAASHRAHSAEVPRDKILIPELAYAREKRMKSLRGTRSEDVARFDAVSLRRTGDAV